MSLSRRQAIVRSLVAAAATTGLPALRGSASASSANQRTTLTPDLAASSATPEALAGVGTALTGRIVIPGDPDYDASRQIWNPRFSKYPMAIVYCQEVQDVVNALKWARETATAFRVRSGG